MPSFMQQEILSTPKIVANQFKDNYAYLKHISKILNGDVPSFVYTLGRGSSGCVGTFIKFVLPCFLGYPVSSLEPSIVNLYKAQLNFNNSWVIVVSQSGQSPDLCETISITKSRGAKTIAFVNDVDSPLAHLADIVIPLLAGEEYSVAATKTFITSLTAFLQFLSILSKNKKFEDLLLKLPDHLEEAVSLQWPSAVATLNNANDVVTLARGYGLAIAQEAALKLKETSILHAEAFSTASFKHGPIALLGHKVPIICFIQDDQTANCVIDAINYFHAIDAVVHLALPETLKDKFCPDLVDKSLILPSAQHPCLDPIIAIQSFYIMAEGLSISRGYNPDKPIFLNKVTKTR